MYKSASRLCRGRLFCFCPSAMPAPASVGAFLFLGLVIPNPVPRWPAVSGHGGRRGNGGEESAFKALIVARLRPWHCSYYSLWPLCSSLCYLCDLLLSAFCFLLSAFCFLLSAFCFL